MEDPERPTLHAGDDLVPGSSTLITWDQAREMQRSGLVEFASHSYDLHRTHIANPQAGELPAGATRAYDIHGGYETEEAYRLRIRADLQRSRALLETELGKAPRALAWPFGRYTRTAFQEAIASKYEFMFTLDSEPDALEDLPIISRLYPVGDADLRLMVAQTGRRGLEAVRLVDLDLNLLSPTNPARFEESLGAEIERIKTLGATTVVVDAAAFGPRGRMEATWFPNRLLPVRADVLSRVVWQLHTRAGTQVVLSLPVTAARAAVGDDAAVIKLFRDMGMNALADGLLLNQAPALVAISAGSSSSEMSWDVRHTRNSIDLSSLPPDEVLNLRAFFAFEEGQPGRRLLLLTQTIGKAPSAIADATLIEAPPAEKSFRKILDRLQAAGWLTAPNRYRSGIWIRAQKPPSATTLSRNVRLFQRRGGVAFGWEPDDPLADEPRAALAAPAFSAANFPVRF
jgi:hypothetical protein